MKKAFYLLLFLVVPFAMAAQTKTISIHWEDQSPSQSSVYKPSSSGDVQGSSWDILKLDFGPGAPSYITQWEDSNFAETNSAKVFNVKYGSVTDSELNKIDKNLVPEELSYSISSSKGRDVLYTIFSISSIIKENGVYKKLLSFSLDYRYGPQNRNAPPAITNSVLASGKWYKFKVEKTGIHKIDKAFLQSLGLKTDDINPRNLKIYGNGGQTLPLLNVKNTYFDLPENSIQVIGEEDGNFGNNDYILFYGTNTEGYVMDNDSNLNPYSDESYYYITADGSAGKRVSAMVEPTGTVEHVISQFTDYQFHEKDEESPTKMGRTWYGNRFDINREQQYDFSFPNIVAGEPMKVVIKVGAASESQTSMAISINGTGLNPLGFSAVLPGVLLRTAQFIGEIPSGGENVSVDFVYNNSGNPSSVAYLDYLSVEATRKLTGVVGQLLFRNKKVRDLTGIGEYQIGNASQFSQVWDVTDPYFITSKQNEGGSSISFKQNLGQVREYVAVNPNDYYSPVKIINSSVANQDLKGSIFKDDSGNFKDVDYIIITAPFLIQPALRLANFHKNQRGLNVKVVTTDRIYEEFSSGKQDIGAIRNFIRYVYYNASEPSRRIKYVGLLGDTSVDYKNRLPNNNNIVPTFHTIEGINEVSSFMSDDFFGNMDDSEGTIGGYRNENGENMPDIDKLDLAMGRMIVDNVPLANAMVDKVINYASKDSYGNWRTNFVLVSDDINKESPQERSLEESLNQLGDEISEKKPFINVKKIHTDSYQQQTSAGGNRYPEVNEAIKNALDVGAIILNYFGHGGEDGLAHEAIYTKEMAQEFRNKDNLPCFVTVTCEFTKFDNPLRITAGELTYQNKEGGAISLVTTTRAVLISKGIEFNKKLADPMFGYDVEVPVVPAEALRLAKNEISDRNRRVIFYIGDPALPLAFPERDIRITKLNGVPVGESTDVLKALSKVKFEGEVTNELGQLSTDYNGTLEAKVFDKNVLRRTLDNNNNGFILDFVTLGEGIYNGRASITNGRFEFEFVVPRDIQIPVGKGRISLYANRNNQLEDRTGVNLDIEVGGLNENAPIDNEGPLIKLFMNDESFVSGGITNNMPILIAKLEDENGINTTSGIGHDIVAILDGDESNPFILNEFYQTEVDDFTKGSTQYKYRDLTDGLHTLTVKAWDVYNNSSTAEIQFIVAGADELEITRVLNYPNPFVNYTEFWFNHNRPFEPLDVQVQVFTVAGKIVWTKNETINTDGFLSRDLVWDGRDDFGDRIGKGVYVYKITVKSTLTNQRVEKFEKLVIL